MDAQAHILIRYEYEARHSSQGYLQGHSIHEPLAAPGAGSPTVTSVAKTPRLGHRDGHALAHVSMQVNGNEDGTVIT